MTVLDKLQRLHNGPTRYELIAECGDQRILISYCMHTGRHALLKECQRHGVALLAMMNQPEDAKIVFLKPARLGAQIGTWSIRFSGRTQREAIQSELPWIGTEPEMVA